MKQFTKPALVLTTFLAISFAAGSATSHETGRQGSMAMTPMHGMGKGEVDGQGSMHGSGMRGGSGMMRGSSMMGGSGMMGGPGMMGSMLGSFDDDNDGKVSPDEMREGLTARLQEFDSDGDGTMNLEEFEAFHAAMIRNMVVDHFQALDEDGDGQITGDEMTAPADRMERFQQMQQRRRDNHMQDGQQRGMGNDRMMNDN
ncbi:EF-hand domain-containing protein [Roseovarius sp. D22-M7]|uniref:EF-hand domain-containing protein n=1 Tax=Roseovarius sp. D22-M7 TaxID=3127116 RepID=UPI0030104FE4